MAKSVTRPDTPLAATPEPVTIGRLKEVRDSLVNEYSKKREVVSNFSGEKNNTLKSFSKKIIESSNNDMNYADKYSKIINKNQK